MMLTRPTSASFSLPFQFGQEVRVSKIPKSLRIPSLDLTIPINPTGKNENGTYALPEYETQAGLISKGHMLGERGSITLAGLSIKKDGNPGIFSRLSELKKDDEIIVMDTSDVLYTYVVYEVGNYDWSPESQARLFILTEKPYLNLIDYGYSYERQSYITPGPAVYATLKEE